MFQMIKGASIPDASALKEEYTVSGKQLTANVSAEHILPVFEAFLRQIREDEPLYLFIEVPCKAPEEQRPKKGLRKIVSGKELPRDVYYLDDLYQEQMLMLLQSGVGELLIHDGLTHFGFGSLESQTELGKYKYNVLIGYAQKEPVDQLCAIFDAFDMPRSPAITTAWDLFSKNSPGDSYRYEFNGKNVYDLIEEMKELGLYKAETRSE